MKNIFLKETDKPSYLFIIDKSKMFVPEAPYLSYTTVGGRVHKTEGSDIYRPQFIYITNEETIKMDEPYLGEDGNIYYLCEGGVNSNGKKIVLTNDTSLIEAGVQEVSSESLSFYAENPVDYVRVEKWLDDEGKRFYSLDFPPKEEQKQHIIEMMQNDEELGLYGANIIDQWLEKYGNPEITKQVEREAEELELHHYSEDYANCNTTDGEFSLLKNAFIAGAEWQKSRMYTEEDMRLAFEVGRNFQLTGENNFNEILK